MAGLGNITIRCQWKKHFEVEPGATGIARLLCRECRRHHPEGAIVVHHFDLATGIEVATRYYRSTEDLFTEKRRERDTAERMARS